MIWRALGPVLVACVLSLVPAAADAKTTTCKIPSGTEDTYGPSYVTSIKATNTTCTRAKALVKAFHKCRLKHGPSGRCATKVSGYACRETRGGIATQFSGKVTCTKGPAKVFHTYTQFT